jgi:DNA replication protein DnaC
MAAGQADEGAARADRLRQQASAEDVDYREPRAGSTAPCQKAAESQRIDAADNLALVGPSGVWKSWLPCAIGQKDCREDRSIVYHR